MAGCNRQVAFTKAGGLLLDELVSTLDSFTRQNLQDYLLSLWSALNIIMVLATHGVEEAVLLTNCVISIQGLPSRIKSIFEATAPWQRGRADHQVQALKETIINGLYHAAQRSVTAVTAQKPT